MLTFLFSPLCCLTDSALGAHFVFDLDGILLYHVAKDPGQVRDTKIVRADTDPGAGGDIAASRDEYRLAEGGPELISRLIERGHKVSVFSFGNATRNVSVAQAIQVPMANGLRISLAAAIARSGGKIYSNVDGAVVDSGNGQYRKVRAEEIARFDPKSGTLSRSVRTVKDLQVILGNEAKDAILIEDTPSNMSPRDLHAGRGGGALIFAPYRYVIGQQGTEVNLTEFNEVSLIEAGDDPVKFEMAIARFDALHNKLAYIEGLILEAEAAAKTEHRPLGDILREMQFELVNGEVQFETQEYQAAGGELRTRSVPKLRLATGLGSLEANRDGVKSLETVNGGRYRFRLASRFENPGPLVRGVCAILDRRQALEKSKFFISGSAAP